VLTTLVHVPAWHIRSVHWLTTPEHPVVAPSGLAGCVHAPTPSQTSRVQTFVSSVQTVPLDAYPFAGQAVPVPGHVSATSHSPAEARQIVPLRKLSPGHAAPEPVQFSATSQTPAEVRHTLVFGRNRSVGQAADDPVQLSGRSQIPAEARHDVPPTTYELLGQTAELPVQYSMTSHTPPEGRQIVVLGRNVLPGHVRLVPLHTPSVAQLPAAASHTVPAATGVQASTPGVSSHPPTHPVSGQRAPDPTQAPAPLHWSVSVQNRPSLQPVPTGFADHAVWVTNG
jgi:hypothetical protein